MSDMEEWSKRIEENEMYGNAKSGQDGPMDNNKALKLKKTGTSVRSASGIPSSGN